MVQRGRQASWLVDTRGLRIKSESLTLEWSAIDFRRGQTTVQAIHAKNGESQTVPMNTILKKALVSVRTRADASGRVFVSRSDELSEAFAPDLQPLVEMLI